ncbi:septum formation initiator [Micromonospora terminaliae]|uniref:Septum formation initiator n=1 Tax=Micromonospora terminaliae TaxID=1914461 RepID=A0AAJ2ZJB1_9ACTN|nr:septum formation initiator [Micromonospora terminaliae]NES30862.1 septum formation initiator [Micromonospora terminaliae]QGL51148.1 septum formation initiator [Micromonospora terminaliae]
MGRRSLLAAAGWLATTAAATLVGLAAIQLVGSGITGTPGGVRDQTEVARALASPAPAATAPNASSTAGATPPATAAGASPAASGAERTFRTPGGTAVAACGPDGVRLVSWSPAPGYRVKEADRGPDEHVEVRFVGAEGEHELRVRCRGSEPVATPHD